MVTGVGAIIGYGALRSLRATGRQLRLVGTDIYADAVGQAWSDAFEQAPLTSSPQYLGWLREVIAKHAVDLIIPGIEQDVHFFSAHRTVLATLGARFVLNDEDLVEASKDKWAMHEALADVAPEIRIPTTLSGEFDRLAREFGLPFLLKPRRSYASKGIVRVGDAQTFSQHAGGLGRDLMAQKLVGDDDAEYTVSAFGDGTGAVCASISLRRRLAQDGSSAKVWVSRFDDLDAIVARLFAKFRPTGPTNLQFRKTEDGWKLLEINPRISSATSLRTAFGYNESAMCLTHFLDGGVITQPTIRQGFAARFIEDYVVYDRDHF